MIIQPVDSGNKLHPYGHAIVAGIERYPSKITRRMSKTRQEKRNKIKPFIKAVNYNHLMPTRYTLELEGLKGAISGETFKEVSQREDAKKTVKKDGTGTDTMSTSTCIFNMTYRHSLMVSQGL